MHPYTISLPWLSDESEKLSRQAREGQVIFCILVAITVYVGIGNLLPHGSLSVSAIDTSSHVNRSFYQNQIKADHMAECKDGGLTQAMENYQGK